MKKLMTGNEAVARGAYEAGVVYASAYPGTPSTEILENTALYKDSILAEWAVNEKVAAESAIGASIAGARSFAAMKHVGVNVAADPLLTYAYMGVNGGFVLISADEPGQHSSQNEQDNRNIAKMAKIALMEPSDSQESKDMFKKAFEISEEFDTPVLFRMTTRICHSKGIVELQDRIEVGIKPYEKNIPKNITVPANSQKMRLVVEERLNKLRDFSNNTDLNFIVDNNSKIGVIASGACYGYAKEVFADSVSYLKLGFTNPLPDKKIVDFCTGKETIYVIEENDSYIEEKVRELGFDCLGNNFFPFCGEKTPDVIRRAVYGKSLENLIPDAEKVVPRPPTLCAGCPHRGFFYEIGKRKNTVIAGDIGCYTLGFAPPYNAMDFNVCMGGAFGSGHGFQQVTNKTEAPKRVVSVVGDSTFFHTAINGLLNVVYNRSNSINIILDNRITGMTGHQENPGSGYTLQGMPTDIVEIEPLVKACGIKNVKTVNPNRLDEVKAALDWAYELDEPSVIITRWPCVLKKFTDVDKKEFSAAFTTKCRVDQAVCIGCKKCIRTGCPALSFDKEAKKSSINPEQCVGCEVCLQVCPTGAIGKVVE
ncbi:MAG: indolepyruvate ferredoxin oxidoreductase subunit alpha [Peptostreptococcaceae bacterium]|nr:indolepyruvate ferredoxin oxidoreductase subunit alpha [Peptostreptococcaceae bacterium]